MVDDQFLLILLLLLLPVPVVVADCFSIVLIENMDADSHSYGDLERV